MQLSSWVVVRTEVFVCAVCALPFALLQEGWEPPCWTAELWQDGLATGWCSPEHRHPVRGTDRGKGVSFRWPLCFSATAASCSKATISICEINSCGGSWSDAPAAPAWAKRPPATAASRRRRRRTARPVQRAWRQPPTAPPAKNPSDCRVLYTPSACEPRCGGLGMRLLHVLHAESSGCRPRCRSSCGRHRAVDVGGVLE
jgi:hypothetical protein